MPRLLARQPSLGLRDASDDKRPIDGLVYDGRDVMAEHRARVREMNTARQRREALLSHGGHVAALLPVFGTMRRPVHTEGHP